MENKANKLHFLPLNDRTQGKKFKKQKQNFNHWWKDDPLSYVFNGFV